MLEQCCNHSKQCRNYVAMLCCAENRRCGSSRVTSPYKSWINCSRMIKRRVVMRTIKRTMWCERLNAALWCLFPDLTLYSLTHFFISFFSKKFTQFSMPENSSWGLWRRRNVLSERTCFIVTFEDVINFNDRPIISCNILLWGTINKRSLTSNKLMWLNGTKQKS